MKIQMLQRLLLVTLLFLGCSTTILSQTGGIKGFVTNEKDGSAVLYSNVILKGTTYGIATDGNGFYSISKVPAGDYTITISAMGFATFEKAVTIEANKTATMNIGVKESSVDLNIFDVNGEKQESQTQVKMSVTKITPQEINQLPTIGGEADFAQYMQVVPGVIFTGDQGGQLYIRGGSPVQNKILLDG
ncbi:TonB-dependent receptor, partial [Salibacteraceae bacterium]|nr:TonB-dependent receptor [Salibacteraceae bacterium]